MSAFCVLRGAKSKRFAVPQNYPFAPTVQAAQNPTPALLPAGNAAHVGQVVGDALVAVDAGLLSREQEALVRHRGPRRLLGDVHGIGAVAVAAFQRIIGLEPGPFMRSKLKPVIQELLAGVDRAEQLAPD